METFDMSKKISYLPINNVGGSDIGCFNSPRKTVRYYDGGFISNCVINLI